MDDKKLGDEMKVAIPSNSEVDRYADYLVRGCPLAGDTNEELLVQWKDAFARLSNQITQDDIWAVRDYECEIKRRGIEPPNDKIKEYLTVIMAKEGRSKIGAVLGGGVKEFYESVGKSKN